MTVKALQKILIVLMMIHAAPLWADWQTEETKIQFLLDEIGRVSGVFIRNGTEHSPESAAAHLKMKMENAMNSWFAPDKDKWTAEMFINKIASKSSLSGKLYQIRFHSGKTVNAGEWLHQKLKDFHKTQ